MNEFKYVDSEFELFADVWNWKAYGSPAATAVFLAVQSPDAAEHFSAKPAPGALIYPDSAGLVLSSRSS